MKLVMLGSGAVGSYFGAQLQKSGQAVIFVARGRQLRALRERGLTVISDGVETRLPSVTATDDIAAIGAVDTVLISIKTWQFTPILPLLTSLKGENTRFLTLQNGVEAPGLIADVIGAENTLGGLVRGFFELDAPGVVRHVGVQPRIIFGQIEGTRTPEAERLLHSFSDAAIAAEIPADIQVALWEKFILVTALGSVGTVTRATIGEVRDYPPTYQMLRDVMREIAAVGRARGVKLSDDVVERTMKFADNVPHEATTSMYRDIVGGLPSELDAQTGAVVRLAREVGVSIPTNQFIYDSLFLQEQRAQATHP
ncbi:MAG TPA: 2-dehydropantoate 2-reductase [Phototrophicaceae bacterium]|nr:2-dehydropantoate 2-reductase [Phototrophicaceae bacterium]